MLTSKEFFSENADDYIALHEALSDSKLSLGWYIATHWKEAGILSARKRKSAILWKASISARPYKLGTRAMKFKAVLCEQRYSRRGPGQ